MSLDQYKLVSVKMLDTMTGPMELLNNQIETFDNSIDAARSAIEYSTVNFNKSDEELNNYIKTAMMKGYVFIFDYGLPDMAGPIIIQIKGNTMIISEAIQEDGAVTAKITKHPAKYRVNPLKGGGY